MRILALDFETGGVPKDTLDEEQAAQSFGQPGPVTLGVALMDGETVVDGKEWLFQPEGRRTYSPGAEAIHGYSVEQMKADGKPVAVVLGELTRFAQGHKAAASKVVAYNAPFDYAFYSDCLFLAGSNSGEGFRHYTAPLFGAWQCAAMLMRAQVPLPRYRLDDAAGHFGLSRSTSSHGALEDAILAGQVYARLAEIHAEARMTGNVATTATGPVADAQRHLASCARGTAEYDQALAALRDVMKTEGAKVAA